MQKKVTSMKQLRKKDMFRSRRLHGKVTPGYIDFQNNTKEKQNLGLNIAGSLMAMQDNVTGGVTAQFQITPTYYLGIFTNIKEGSFVSSDVKVGPAMFKLPNGMNAVEYKAVLEEGVDSLRGPEYSYD